jgi:hypothetical protein
MLALDTAQMGVVTNALLNWTPSCASLSMFGVLSAGIIGLSTQLNWSHLWSSAIRIRKFGLLLLALLPSDSIVCIAQDENDNVAKPKPVVCKKTRRVKLVIVYPRHFH